MKFSTFIFAGGIAWTLSSCLGFENGLNAINSVSLPEKNITLGSSLMKYLLTDSLIADSIVNIQESNQVQKKMDEMLELTDRISKTKSDKTWSELSSKWNDFNMDEVGKVKQISSTEKLSREWANINIRLLKLSGEVRFADVLEKMIYESKVPILTEKMIQSIIFTRVDDQVFVNLIGPSEMNYQHTTGGNIKIIQKTDFPANQEMTILIECDDKRFMAIYIRIPEWAVNPTVNHGNVKYVPYPGQFCEVSRMWNNGDEIKVTLKN